MLRFHAEKFVALTSVLRSMTMYFHSHPDSFRQEDRGMIALELAKALELLEGIGLRQSAKKAKKISEQTKFAGYDGRHYSVAIDELQERIKDELEDGYFLHLNGAEHALYEPPMPLCGQEVHQNFPSAAYDISETGKCMALGRSTAAVMHAMRVLEPGLLAMAKDVGFTPKRDNWGAAIDEIEDRLKPGHLNYINDKDKRERLSPAATQFRYFKDAWRNHAMHARDKYTPEEANDVATAVKAFMMHLAKIGLKE